LPDVLKRDLYAAMDTAIEISIREATLRDPRYPVHRIADRLLPYLRVLVEQFKPKEVILFGSYAYGCPGAHSDIDLLVIRDVGENPVEDAVAIRRAWRPVRATIGSLPFDLLVVSTDEHTRRLTHSAGFYEEIVERGVRLA
jgi:hypothetical protein